MPLKKKKTTCCGTWLLDPHIIIISSISEFKHKLNFNDVNKATIKKE